VINSDNSYASYFELWLEKPGLPYLHAHFQARSIQAGSESEFLQDVQDFASMALKKLVRVEQTVRVRRKTQYCCKCRRRRKYDSEQFCTCSHERCEECSTLNSRRTKSDEGGKTLTEAADAEAQRKKDWVHKEPQERARHYCCDCEEEQGFGVKGNCVVCKHVKCAGCQARRPK
jgi:hypothetical protein